MRCHFSIDFDDPSDMLRPCQAETVRKMLNSITDAVSKFVIYNRNNPLVHMEFESHEKKKNEKKKI